VLFGNPTSEFPKLDFGNPDSHESEYQTLLILSHVLFNRWLQCDGNCCGFAFRIFFSRAFRVAFRRFAHCTSFYLESIQLNTVRTLSYPSQEDNSCPHSNHKKATTELRTRPTDACRSGGRQTPSFARFGELLNFRLFRQHRPEETFASRNYANELISMPAAC
jgi:hypothetical protein